MYKVLPRAPSDGFVDTESTSPTYALALLTAVYAFNQLDRQILALMLESIKADFEVSDTVLGLISGIGFAAIYVVSSLVFSRWADRGPRIAIVSGGLAVFSVITACTGFVQNFYQLAITRIGIAIGEGTSIAPSTSVISDYFPIASRGRAMSIFSGGGFLATITLFPVLGWIAEHWGWREAFVVAGLPGLILSLLLWRTVRDPVRGSADGTPDAGTEPVAETLRFLVKQRTVLLACASACFSSWPLYCFAIWTPTFLSRVHDMNHVEIAFISGVIGSTAGLCGALAGGAFADWLGRFDVKWRLTGPALLTLLNIPAGCIFLFAESDAVMLPAFALLSFITISPIGATWAGLQSAAKPRMRALTSSIYLTFWMMAGLGIGTLVVGMLNDYLNPTLGVSTIRYSLLAPLVAQLIGSPLLALAGLCLGKDMARVNN